MLEIPKKRVDIRAVGSSRAERVATLIAFFEGVPIVSYREDGSVFSVTYPHSYPCPPDFGNESSPTPSQDEDT